MPNNFYELLKYAATGVASPDMTYYDRVRASTLMGGTVKTLTGQPPLSFKSDGKPLISWGTKGNGSQTGTPTPDAPIMPDFCGKLVGADWTIPITCAGQTVPVYLGQVSTTRRIKKLVLTGEENWGISNSRFYLASLTPDYLRGANQVLAVCSHYISSPQVASAMNVPAGCISFSYAAAQRLYCYDTSITTVPGFKEFLAAQYTAGTPVTVWYVLAEPETGIVNEPLCKIGDYADELSSTDAGVSIPTVKGQNTLTVDTDLQPSEMTITYRG